MVFFSCNACGRSVKKNQVEKHYQLQCRRCEVLSCVDCGVEFRGDDYKGHTRCISEEEKYGGKDFKLSPSANKGEVKQDKWIENIQRTIAAATVRSHVSILLERLLTFSNIPRKKVRFEKFLGNSLKVYDAKLISEIWDIVNEVNSDQSGQNDTRKTTNSQEADDLLKESDKNDLKMRPIEHDQDNCISKKRNKHKHKMPNEDETGHKIMNLHEESERGPCKNCEGEGCVICQENYTQNESEQVDFGRKKKKKHKQKKAADEEIGVETFFESNESIGRKDCEEKHENCESECKLICSKAKKKKEHKIKKRAALNEENLQQEFSFPDKHSGELENEAFMDEGSANNEERRKYYGSEHEGICSEGKKKNKPKKDKVADDEYGKLADDNNRSKRYRDKPVSGENRGRNGSKEVDCEQFNFVAEKKKKHKRRKGKIADEENGVLVDENNRSNSEREKPVVGENQGRNGSEEHKEVDGEQFDSVAKKKKKHKRKNVSNEEKFSDVIQNVPEMKKRKKNKAQNGQTELH